MPDTHGCLCGPACRAGDALDGGATASDAGLEDADFSIGREFWTERGRWRCTDVRTRTICAISLEPCEVVTLHPDGTSTSAITDDPSRWEGPPYAVAESAFDETSFGALYASPEDVPRRDRRVRRTVAATDVSDC